MESGLRSPWLMRVVVWGGADGGTYAEGRAPALSMGIWGLSTTGRAGTFDM
jgi:hypothetical protein